MLLLLFLLSLVSWAHPFGAELNGHLVEVRLSGSTVRVDYLAEVSTVEHLRDLRAFAARATPDTTPLEQRYIERVLDELDTGIQVVADGQDLRLRRVEVTEESGLGDSRFVGFRLALEAELPPGTQQLNVVNGNLPGRPALFNTRLLVSDEIVVDECSLFQVVEGTLKRDRSNEWVADEGARELRLSFRVRSEAGAALNRGFRRLAATGPVDDYVDAAGRLSTVEPDPLLDLVRGEITPITVGLGLLTAIVLGVLHGLSPGHGKALVAAYLVGSRRSYRQAVALGLVVTITHTLAVFVLGAVALVLAERFDPQRVLPWMELASGLLIVGVGLHLLRQRAPAMLRSWSRSSAPAAAPSHDHDHAHAHAHEHSHSHSHSHEDMDPDEHARLHIDQVAQAGDGWKGLVALGISGGLVPCPSALVLLLTAIGLQRVGLGLVLVTAFSFGLALLVSGLGIAVLLLGDRLSGLSSSGRVRTVLPAFSAVVVSVLGAAISWRGVLSVVALFAPESGGG